MAIGTNTSVLYHGTQDTVSAGGGTSAVNNAAYSASGDAATWTNDDDAPMASFVLTMQYPSGTITTGGIQLMCRMPNVDGTGDEPALTANWTGHFLGNFTTGTGMSATTNYSLESGPVDLPNIKTSTEYEFYLLNSCGVTMTAGWTLKVTPLAYGPN
jgi:hypothetical protein